MKKISTVVLTLLMFVGVGFAEESLFDYNAPEEPTLPEVTITLTAPLFGLKYEGWNSYWYDFYSKAEVSPKFVKKTIYQYPESKKLIKQANFNYVLSACISAAGIAGFVTYMCSDDADIKKVSSAVGGICSVAWTIPFFIGTSKTRQALDIYNYSVLEN